MDNEELTKMIVQEKDKIELQYKQKINNIKKYYGVEFDVSHFKNGSIKDIRFANLKYRKNYNKISIIYDYKTDRVGLITYEFSDSNEVRKANHKLLLKDLDKEYKLHLIISEVRKVNREYVEEINELENTLRESLIDENNIQKTLEIRKQEEN